jgi:hypothetical protein
VKAKHGNLSREVAARRIIWGNKDGGRLHLFEIGLTHGEIRVAALPFEVGVIATAFLQPEIGDAFQFLHPFGLRDGATEPRQRMHMILHAANLDGRAIQLFGDAAEIRMERVARGFVAQPRPPVFGGENQMDANGGKGLWHDGRMVNGVAIFQSQRDCVLVAREREFNAPRGHRPPAQGCEERATLGIGSKNVFNPNGVAAIGRTE